MPVAFDASEEREILRALAFAKEFNLDPIIVGGAEAANVIEDLKAAKARVIVSANFQAAGGVPAGAAAVAAAAAATPTRRCASSACVRTPRRSRRRWRRRAFRSRSRPAACRIPADFVRGVGRTVREGGLAEDAALKALTINAAKLAGAGDRLGSIEKGKMANVIVTEGSLFDSPRIRHVFVAGWPLDLDIPAQGTGRGGRGSQ